jgi:hypothetical protein
LTIDYKILVHCCEPGCRNKGGVTADETGMQLAAWLIKQGWTTFHGPRCSQHPYVEPEPELKATGLLSGIRRRFKRDSI